MATEKLDDLFNRELEETYLAEKLLLDLFSNPAAPGTAHATTVEVGFGQAQERVRRLERIFALTKDTPDVAKRPAPGLESIIAAIEERQAHNVGQLATQTGTGEGAQCDAGRGESCAADVEERLRKLPNQRAKKHQLGREAERNV